MKLLDTTFLIDLQKERRRRTEGAAHQFLSDHPDTSFGISIISLIEYEEGFPDSELAAARQFLHVFPVREINVAVARTAGRIRRSLRASGQLIGDHDILIAATALEHDFGLVTDNASHFERIEGLRLENYRK